MSVTRNSKEGKVGREVRRWWEWCVGKGRWGRERDEGGRGWGEGGGRGGEERGIGEGRRSEERRVGEECRSRWSP